MERILPFEKCLAGGEICAVLNMQNLAAVLVDSDVPIRARPVWLTIGLLADDINAVRPSGKENRVKFAIGKILSATAEAASRPSGGLPGLGVDFMF